MNGSCEGCKNECKGMCSALTPPEPCQYAWLGNEDDNHCVMYDEAE
jgi:hypothetical protein